MRHYEIAPIRNISWVLVESTKEHVSFTRPDLKTNKTL
jgi:hypothetical protein